MGNREKSSTIYSRVSKQSIITLLLILNRRLKGKLLFYRLQLDPMDYFLLDPKTGELHTARPLDREALPDATGIIVLTVRVCILLENKLFFQQSSKTKIWKIKQFSRLVS